jgi:hypothetical protein
VVRERPHQHPLRDRHFEHAARCAAPSLPVRVRGDGSTSRVASIFRRTTRWAMRRMAVRDPGISEVALWAHLRLEEEVLVTAHGPQPRNSPPFHRS